MPFVPLRSEAHGRTADSGEGKAYILPSSVGVAFFGTSARWRSAAIGQSDSTVPRTGDMVAN